LLHGFTQRDHVDIGIGRPSVCGHTAIAGVEPDDDPLRTEAGNRITNDIRLLHRQRAQDDALYSKAQQAGDVFQRANPTPELHAGRHGREDTL